MRNKRGQSILEYVIILTAVIAAVIIASSKIQTGVGKNIDASGDLISTQTDKIKL